MPHDIISLSSDDDDFGTLARPSASSARSQTPPTTQPSPLETLTRVSSSAGTKAKTRVTTKRGRGEAVVGGAAVAPKRPRTAAPEIVSHRQGAPDAATLFDRYRPKRMGDLATSGVRNTAITAWLQGCVRPSPRSRVLFLHGRPGSGKASLVRVAAESLGLSQREWVAVENRALDAVDYHENTSQLQYFRRALLHDRSFSRDVVGADTESKVLVFHGLPHCHTLAQQKERADVLRQFVKELKEPSHGLEYPVVFLYTSYATHSQNFQLHEDFPNEFLDCPQIEKVEIHNITERALRKRLKHVAAAECATQRAAAAAVDEVMLHVEGDVRQALHTLAFALITPEPRGPVSPDLVAPPAMLQRALGVPEVVEGSDFRANRTVIDIAHAAARVLAAKREEDGPLCHSLDETLGIVGVGADKLTDYVHHSLPRYCQVEGGLEKLAAVTRNMSDANVYGTLLSSQHRASGWTSRCLFSWSLQKYTQAPEPSRSKSFEACHPPPVCVPAHELSVLRRTMESATSDEMASSHASGQLGLEVWPMVRNIVFQRRQQSLFRPAPARAAPPAAAPQQLLPSPPKPVPFTGKPVLFTGKPVPFGQPAKPVPFTGKPVPFTGKPVPFERPVPFDAVVAKPRGPPPPPVLLTQVQLQTLKALCHYSRGQWQRPNRVDVRAAIALKWKVWVLVTFSCYFPDSLSSTVVTSNNAHPRLPSGRRLTL